MADNRTLKEIFDTFTEDEKNVTYFLIGKAIEDAKKNPNTNQPMNEEGEDNTMGHNAFDNENTALTMSDLIRYAKNNGGSLGEAYLAHADDDPAPYGIGVPEGATYTMGDVLFPDYQPLNKTPILVNNPDDWVKVVMNGVHHSPFARVKTSYSDISDFDEETLRAKGYIKGNQKKEEFITVVKRTTDPQTIYKKQKLDRDDIIDITDFDVVNWLKAEMRMKLDEEIARAILVGDGRLSSSEDKIQETHIRPIWKDDDAYTVKYDIGVSSSDTDADIAKQVIAGAVRARKQYKGSGNPILFTSEDMLTEMLLLEDTQGYRLYKSESELASAMRVSKIVTSVALENLTRSITVSGNSKTATLRGLVVNLTDYNVGADKGGAVNTFEDFDIDVNQQKYLIETRCSGALVRPKAAIAIETYEA